MADIEGPQGLSGGLAPWRLRRSVELIMANVQAEVSAAELARACRLSERQFRRAFKQTVGASPHQWHMMQRLKLARALIETGGASLSEVAAECGFADQSHLTRVFHKVFGVTPGSLRREAESKVG